MDSKVVNTTPTALSRQWQNLTRAMDDYAPPEDPELVEKATQEIARAKCLARYIQSRIDRLDTRILRESQHEQLESTASIAKQLMDLYNGNDGDGFYTARDPSLLESVNAELDDAVEQVQRLPIGWNDPPPAQTDMRKLNAAIAQQISIYEGGMQALRGMVTTDIASLSQSLSSHKSDLDNESTRLSERLKEVETQINQQVTNHAATFQEAESARSRQFIQSEAARTSQFTQLIEKTNDRLDKIFEDTTIKIGVTLSTIEDLKRDVEQVAGTVIVTAQAGAYATYASQEKRAADWARAGAFCCMLVAAGLLIIPLLAELKTASTIDWKSALYRIPLSVVMLVPAFYLGRESSKHRENEIKNRRREHIIRTIEPYVSRLDPSRAEDVRSTIAKSLFSDATEPARNRNDSEPQSEERLVSALARALRELVKRD